MQLEPYRRPPVTCSPLLRHTRPLLSLVPRHSSPRPSRLLALLLLTSHPTLRASKKQPRQPLNSLRQPIRACLSLSLRHRTMKIVSLMVLRALDAEPDANILASAYFLDNFGYFQREPVKQFATFVSKTVAKRVELGQRSSIEHESHLVHVHVRSNGLAAVAVCDAEYPSRVAFTLLMKVQEDFMTAHADATWLAATDELPFPPLDDMIRKYQDPHEADAIMKIQKDLDDTKIILHKTIDSVLERGVKLDNLVEKSTDLSAQSKMYVTAKKQNSCCSMM
ncbi:unnamed protein product [Chondrus crispus]|uniref:Uncharacterized protein n=1 Tax=Chondrus crispus TaxID=2769 RepID=R7QFE4_CHOCR|nr:unnamed protein product [Chondrus crispus]CDF37247.1 unnamed protein product [Chondrus crispus]|eukprot:XP_005717066.1 unnamed protein product [Chondrus crispus]